MIGRIAFTWGTEPRTATLGDDGRWTCPASPATAAYLDDLCSPARYGPADGDGGIRSLNDAAALLGGTVAEIERRPTPPVDRIY